MAENWQHLPLGYACAHTVLEEPQLLLMKMMKWNVTCDTNEMKWNEMLHENKAASIKTHARWYHGLQWL